MTDSIKLDLQFMGKETPVFVTAATTPEFSRVFGVKYLQKKDQFIFPAFYPFGLFVLHDIDTISGGDYTLSPESQAQVEHLVTVKECLSQKTYPEFEDFNFVTEPLSYQKETLKEAIHHPRYGILLGCGLGKTKVLIDLIRYLRHKGEGYRSLIVVPTVVIDKWELEFAKHSENDFKIFQAYTGKSTKKKLIEKFDSQEAQEADVVLTTHKSACSDYINEFLGSKEFHCMAVDESHKLKTPTSRTTETLVKLGKKAYRRYILSGTPSSGNPLHLYGQLKFLGDFNIVEPNLFMFQRKFLQYEKIKVFNKKKGKRVAKFVPRGYKNLEILHKRLDRISVKRQPDDCLDLPDLRTLDYSYQLSREQIKLYNELATARPSESPEKFNLKEEAFGATRITKLAQILSGFYRVNQKDGTVKVVETKKNPKLESFSELAESILAEPQNKLVVWAYFTKELDDLKQALAEYEPLVIDGTNKSAAIDFDKDPDKRVLIGQVSLGEGFDAVSANYTIYYSTDFDPSKYNQSLKRVYRIGQERKVTVYRLKYPNAIDDFIYKILAFKDEVSNIITERNYCALCPEHEHCLTEGIKMFGEGCEIPTEGERIIATPMVLDDDF